MLLSAVAIVGFSISYVGNRRLQESSLDAMRGASGLRSDPGRATQHRRSPPARGLGATLDTVAQYERHGPPWRLQWGLYTGSSLFPPLRRSYFEGFERLLFATTRDSMVAELAALPDAPDSKSDYGADLQDAEGVLIRSL